MTKNKMNLKAGDSRSGKSEASLQKKIGIVMGVVLTLSAIWIISAISVSFAHENTGNAMMGNDMMSRNNMMSGSGMSMMHSMMMDSQESMMDDSSDMMNCMSMMKNHVQMTQEEIEEMMKQMDKDGDGLCDYCGMSVDMCRKMMDNK